MELCEFWQKILRYIQCNNSPCRTENEYALYNFDWTKKEEICSHKIQENLPITNLVRTFQNSKSNLIKVLFVKRTVISFFGHNWKPGTWLIVTVHPDIQFIILLLLRGLQSPTSLFADRLSLPFVDKIQRNLDIFCILTGSCITCCILLQTCSIILKLRCWFSFLKA